MKRFTYEEIPPKTLFKKVLRSLVDSDAADFKVMKDGKTIYILRGWDRFYMRNAITMMNRHCGENK